MKLPFGWLPGHWGLKGKTRDVARAEYELPEGYERDRKIAEITHGDDEPVFKKQVLKLKKKHNKIEEYDYEVEQAKLTYSGENLELKLLEIDLRFAKIKEYDYDLRVAAISFTGSELELAKLEIELKHEKIDDQAFNKMVATVKGEPYVAIVSSTYAPATHGINGPEIELDWNHLWIEKLVAAGYTGHSEDQIISEWFRDVCRGVMLEGAENEPIPFNSRRTATRMPHEGGPTDYS